MLSQECDQREKDGRSGEQYIPVGCASFLRVQVLQGNGGVGGNNFKIRQFLHEPFLGELTRLDQDTEPEAEGSRREPGHLARHCGERLVLDSSKDVGQVFLTGAEGREAFPVDRFGRARCV